VSFTGGISGMLLTNQSASPAVSNTVQPSSPRSEALKEVGAAEAGLAAARIANSAARATEAALTALRTVWCGGCMATPCRLRGARPTPRSV
jgi:hypothetical protein